MNTQPQPSGHMPEIAKYSNHPLRKRDLGFNQRDDISDIEAEVKATGFLRMF